MNKLTIYLLPVILLFTLFSCGNNQKSKATKVEATGNQFVDSALKAHEKAEFLAYDAIQFDLQLFFGGTERVNATMTLATDSGKGKIQMKSGDELMYINDQVFSLNEVENAKSTRFAAYTWAYFFSFPFKMNDSGTVWSSFDGISTINGDEYNTQKLTFNAGTGDAPDDWYIAYQNKETDLIDGASYIVTFSKSKEDAETNPSAIRYYDYEKVEGIPIARTWKFMGWSETDGFSTEEKGNATITNVKLIKDLDPEFFTATDEMHLVE